MIKTRLEKIEKLMSSNSFQDLPLLTLMAFQSWQYDIGEKKPLSINDWQIYRDRTIFYSNDKIKAELELDNLKEKMIKQNGFIDL